MFVYWTPENIDHIGKHGVDQDEVEYVLENIQRPYPQSIGHGKFAVWGRTASGRWLQVIFVYRPVESIELTDVPPHRRLELDKIDEVTYVIHARDLEPHEKRRFNRRRGKL